jgi:two-component system chemotaxis response regulator CheB
VETSPSPTSLPAASQPVRVLIVDDSAMIRGVIARALRTDPEILVVASASNGKMAIDVLRNNPDIEVIILDIEMPEMDGLTTLPILLKTVPGVQVIMASTLTLRNAEISFKALALGASDYVPKPSARDLGSANEFKRELIEKIKAIAPAVRKVWSKTTAQAETSPSLAVQSPQASLPLPPVSIMEHAEALAVASSTGGPQALVELFKGLAGKLDRVPVFVTQHMPPSFTTILAQNISKVAGIPCHEAVDGEIVKPGVIYVAPGHFHLIAEAAAGGIIVRITQSPPENFCRPSADPMFRSLAAIYGRKLLGVVLTGMGSDGKVGAEQIVASGGQILAQDEETSVVWGMPRAVAEAKLAKAVLPLPQLPLYIMRAIT